MMKRKICFLIAIIFIILGCGITPVADVYETDTFSFGIPDDWHWGAGDIRIFGSAFQQIVGIRNPQGLIPSANLTVLTSPLSDGANLETRFIETYANTEFFEDV